MLMEYLSEVDKDHDDRLPQLLNALQMEEAKTVTEDIMKQLVNQNTQQQKRPSSSELQIINAFETPRLVYQATRRQFQVEETKKSLFGSAEDKVGIVEVKLESLRSMLLLKVLPLALSSIRSTCFRNDTHSSTNVSCVTTSFVLMILVFRRILSIS